MSTSRVEHMRDLVGFVWCRTCSHTHIPDIPTTTWACRSCGFGAWATETARDHADRYPEHIVYASHHETVPQPTPTTTRPGDVRGTDHTKETGDE